jgi:branched-chain amino acid aminotransferase
MEQAELIWHNGEFVAWEDAKVHVLSHGLHYGTGVFEGIRCYETERGPAIFRHRDHLTRLEKSAELYYLKLPHSAEDLRLATHEHTGSGHGRHPLEQCSMGLAARRNTPIPDAKSNYLRQGT